MKKKIIFGSLLAVFLMMMLPSVPAVEYNTAVEANESRILDELRNIDLEELKIKIQSIDIKSFKEELKDDPALPLCFPISGIIFYTLIALILLRIVFYVISTVVGVLAGVIGTIASVVIGAICAVLGFVGKILGFIFSTIIGVMGLIAKAIGGVIGLTASVLGAIMGFMGKIIGLILDILLLIYGVIFPGFSSAA